MKNINSLKYQLLFFYKEKLISKNNIWKKEKNGEEKIREEIIPISNKTKVISIWNSNKKLFYMYSPEKNSGRGGKINYEPNLEGSKNNLLKESESIKKLNPVIVGRETLDGKDCLIIETTVDGNKIKHWVWIEYGLSIMIIDAPIKSEAKRREIEVNIDIPDNLFELPAEIQITSSIPSVSRKISPPER